MLVNKKVLTNNYRGRWYLVRLLFLVTAFYSCHENPRNGKVARAFYYWKSVVKLTSFESKRLDSLHVKTIYLKFFDVDLQDSSGRPVPNARLQIQDRDFVPKYHIIPTVFITNACLQKIDSSQTILLAGKIYGLIKVICEMYLVSNIDEIQLDCDWTAATRNKYFSLLRSIKQLSNTTISATIRLHQVKFISQSGIPPVDKGMLMCYNMGDLKNPAVKNSIIETGEIKKYIANLSSYPLPLDVALPLFEWKVLFRDNIYKGLIENIPAGNFSNSFSRITGNRVEILKDTLLLGYDLKKGDILRSEESDLAEITAAANEINKQLKNAGPRIALYHLDSLTLNKFTTNELESIYSTFR